MWPLWLCSQVQDEVHALLMFRDVGLCALRHKYAHLFSQFAGDFSVERPYLTQPLRAQAVWFPLRQKKPSGWNLRLKRLKSGWNHFNRNFNRWNQPLQPRFQPLFGFEHPCTDQDPPDHYRRQICKDFYWQLYCAFSFCYISSRSVLFRIVTATCLTPCHLLQSLWWQWWQWFNTISSFNHLT